MNSRRFLCQAGPSGLNLLVKVFSYPRGRNWQEHSACFFCEIDGVCRPRNRDDEYRSLWINLIAIPKLCTFFLSCTLLQGPPVFFSSRGSYMFPFFFTINLSFCSRWPSCSAVTWIRAPRISKLKRPSAKSSRRWGIYWDCLADKLLPREACVPAHSCPGGGAERVLIIFLGGGVPPGPENPYPISDQNIHFRYPISDLTLKMYTLFQTVRCGNFGHSKYDLQCTGLRDPQTTSAVTRYC